MQTAMPTLSSGFPAVSEGKAFGRHPDLSRAGRTIGHACRWQFDKHWPRHLPSLHSRVVLLPKPSLIFQPDARWDGLATAASRDQRDEPGLLWTIYCPWNDYRHRTAPRLFTDLGVRIAASAKGNGGISVRIAPPVPTPPPNCMASVEKCRAQKKLAPDFSGIPASLCCVGTVNGGGGGN
jgi:hypothetical protein